MIRLETIMIRKLVGLGAEIHAMANLMFFAVG